MTEKLEDYEKGRAKNTAIKRCTCSNSFQDKRYGVGLRLHNRKQKASDGGWRCTVCGKSK